MDYKLEIVLLLTIGFALASLLGIAAQRLKLPSILGFLVAGYLIGPYSPGFVADVQVAEQLAEIGVVLMLFGVGLHFRLQDLLNVKKIAIPGALGQTAVATLCGMFFVSLLGWQLQQGLLIGLAISVASTVVLVRVLSDNHFLDTVQGHIAIGWLIVEDVLTIVMLVLLPVVGMFMGDATTPSFVSVGSTIALFLAKFLLLIALLLKWGVRVLGALLTAVARFKNQELFTLTVLAVTFVVAIGSALIFAASIALGAFLAGMVIGQTKVRHQAFVTALPLKDAFTVIFFLSIGMLFNPTAIYQNLLLFSGILAIVLCVKPLAAYGIVRCLGYPSKVGVIVALALAQIGEFSFILAEQAVHMQLLPDVGYDVLVACALVSISLNPLLFRYYFWKKSQQGELKVVPAGKDNLVCEKITRLFEESLHSGLQAIVVGYGPIGERVTQLLEKKKVAVSIVEHNIDALAKQSDAEHKIIYGDASVDHILQITHIAKASLLVITVPEIATAVSIIHAARSVNPTIAIISRITYLSEKQIMDDLGVDWVCAEEQLQTAFEGKIALFYKGSI